VQHQKGAVNYSLAVGRNIGQVVNGFVKRGKGVDVEAKLNANRFKVVDYTLTRKMLGAVESHVLQKMCQTVLVILLKYCTYILGNKKFCALLGFGVLPNVVG